MTATPASRRFLSSQALAIGVSSLALLLAAGSLAIANISPHASFDEAGHDRAEAALPAPVMGDDLFTAPPGQSGCMNDVSVIAEFAADESEIGGKTFEIVASRGQDLADLWRDQAGAERVTVSAIIGHLFFDRDLDEWTVDLVELDAAGCAISRTFLPEPAVTSLLELSRRT